MALVTAAVLKQYLPEITGTAADSDLTSLIDRVESAIARWLGFPISDSGTTPSLDASTYTLYLDGPMNTDAYVLPLPVRPLVSITSIHTDPNRSYGSSTEIDSSTWVLDKQNSRVILKPETATLVFDYGFRAIKVVCSAGYNTSNPPQDLIMAICIWASQLQRNKNNQGKDSISQRQSTIKLSPKNMPYEVKEFLFPLRNQSVLF